MINNEISHNDYEKRNAHYKTVKNIQTNVDSVLKINLELAKLISFNKEASNFAKDKEIDYYHVTKLASLIGKYKGVVFGDIIAFQPDKNIYIGAGATYSESDIIKTYGAVPYDGEYLKTLPGGCYSSASMTDNLNNNKIVVIDKCTTLDADDLYFIIAINSDYLKSFLNSVNDSISIIEQKKVIYSTNGADNLHEFQNGSMTSASDIVHNWEYCYRIDEDVSLWFYLKWMIILLISMVLSTVIGEVISTRLYNPIKRMVERISGDENVEDELKYIENKMIELKKEHTKLSSEKTEYIDKFEQQFLINIIYGIATHKDVDEYENKSGTKNSIGYSFALLECTDNDEAAYSKNIYEIYNHIRRLNLGKTVCIENRKIAIILSGGDRTLDELIKVLETLIEEISQKFGMQYICAVSDERTQSLYGISGLFLNADKTLKNKSLFKNNVAVATKSIENDDYYYSVDMEKIILDHIKNDKCDEALSMIDSVLRKNLIECELSHDAMSDFKMAIVTTIKRTLKIVGKTEKDLFDEDSIMYLELGVMSTQEALMEKIKSIFRTIIDAYNSGNDKNNNFLVEGIIQYIDENYYDANKMCLTGIAEHFGLSTSYVSRIFKNYKNVNFKEYVTLYRINAAKNILLQKPHIKIKELSEMVGYTSVNSFIRAFEKQEGLTPDLYRKKMKKN
ncbi:MAG: helix-turn-helix transcriptional regulator [Clostridia bacterium]|nr:helix-turn-helix transcriptional regulator [Clostridia bacterium]